MNMFLTETDLNGVGATPDDMLDEALDLDADDLGRWRPRRRLRSALRRAGARIRARRGRKVRMSPSMRMAMMRMKKKGMMGLGAEEEDILAEALELEGMGAFYDDWLNYVKDNPLLVGGVAVGTIALIVGAFMLKKKLKGSPA